MMNGMTSAPDAGTNALPIATMLGLASSLGNLRRLAITYTTAISPRPIRIPGMMPPRKSEPIDTPAIVP